MPQPPNAPAGPRPWYHVGPVVAEADGDGPERTTADVYLYDVVGGWWGLSADDFVRDVAGLDVDHIVLHLNTPGGEVSEGVAIANMLRQHRADVRVMVDGMAASSGSVIAMAGDEVVMGLGSQMMVHNPRTWAVGDVDEMQKVARQLESTAEAIASTYAAKAGGTVDEWRELMKAETWYSAEEAVKAGLADRVATDEDKGTATGRKVTPGRKAGLWDMWDTLRSQDRLDLSPFVYQGRENAPAPTLAGRKAGRSSAPPDAALAAAAQAAQRIRGEATKTTTADPTVVDPNPKEASVDAAKIREALGLASDAPDTEVTAALAAAGLGQAGPPANPPGDQNEPAPPVVKPNGAVPAGMRLVSDSAWEQMQNTIKRLEAREARREREERDQVVAQAVRDGKFTPAQRDHFAKLWDADPEGTRTLIASLQKNTALAVAELGHGGDVTSDEAAEDAMFDNLFPPSMRYAGKGQ